MMRRLMILACVFVLAGLARAAIAPTTSNEQITDTAGTVLAGEAPAMTTQPEPVIPPPASGPFLASSEPAPKGPNPLWAIPLSGLTATRDRPIFSASRRPPPAAVVPVAAIRAPPPRPTEPEKPRLALVGTIVGEADGFGIFVDQTSKAALRLKPGEEHNGWTLRSLRSREATLEKDQLTAIVTMPPPGKGSEADIPMTPSFPPRAVAAEQERPTRRLH
jgi:hypothetical protein